MEQCKAHALTAVAIAGFVVSSCSSSGRPAIYVLDDAAPGQPGVTEVLGKPVVGLQHVQLPDYLDTTDIMTHRAGGRIHASTTGQWGDRLSTGVTRTLAESLGTQLPEVSVRGLPSTERPWLRLTVDISIFEAQADGRCVLSGRWIILGRDGAELDEHEFLISTPVQSYDDASVVAAMGTDLNQLTTEIAATVRRLEPKHSLLHSRHSRGQGPVDRTSLVQYR
jgi:uncharacterized protein